MIPELQQLGFTRNEANVYFTALKLGSCSVQQLANATGLNRITVHSIVEKFESLQIFMRSFEGKRRRVQPVDPNQLKNLLEKEKNVLDEKQRSLASALPHLREMFRRTQRGLQMITFQGEEGYERMCEDVLQTKADMLEYANFDALNAVIGSYIAKDYLPRKFKLGIRTKFLYMDTSVAREYITSRYMKDPKAAPMEAKFIDPREFPLDTFFVIYGDKLSIFTPSTMDGVIIHDQAIADSMRPFFMFVWQRAGRAMRNY